MKCPCCGCEDEFIKEYRADGYDYTNCPCCGSIICYDPNTSYINGYVILNDMELARKELKDSHLYFLSQTKYFHNKNF